MISKECYIYFQLPDSMEVVTLGRLQWRTSGSNSDLGTMVYGKKYLSNEMPFLWIHFNFLCKIEHLKTV